jgi:micrococcal nuclease
MGNCLAAVQHVLEAAAPEKEQQPAAAAPAPAPGGLSPVYESLPAGAEQHSVRNVYDGDTLTLVNEDRVRLLGIDTPEIKEKQPFSQEAKEYTYSRCHKKDIWISYEPDGDQKDHYGRLLAFVWVREDGGGYLCVNEGIVAAGLATAYAPNAKQKRLHNWDKLVALQRRARRDGRGMWSAFSDRDVVKTANGAAYHVRSCEHLSSVKNLTELKESDAQDQGLHPCRTCLS